MKFLLDVNAGGPLADYLEGEGHNVELVSRLDLRMSDDDILRWAFREKRIIVTTDSDFDQMVWLQRRDVLVTVKVPPEIDKSEFERNWDSGYQAGLKAGREESAALLASTEQRANSSEAIALALAQNPTPIQNTQNTTMSDRSQTIEVQGNVDNSVIGQGDSNRLTNKAQQPQDPQQ
ncbi:MAG: DUF5615 family PIN-like protein [Cyanobacteria bacterium J06560_6]